MLEIICVPVIVTLVFIIMEGYKKFIAKEKETLIRIIPLIAGTLGVLFGILFYYTVPEIISATNVGVAMLVGLASGLSATGCNQIFKQLSKFGVSVTEVKSKELTENKDGDADDQSN